MARAVTVVPHFLEPQKPVIHARPIILIHAFVAQVVVKVVHALAPYPERARIRAFRIMRIVTATAQTVVNVATLGHVVERAVSTEDIITAILVMVLAAKHAEQELAVLGRIAGLRQVALGGHVLLVPPAQVIVMTGQQTAVKPI